MHSINFFCSAVSVSLANRNRASSPTVLKNRYPWLFASSKRRVVISNEKSHEHTLFYRVASPNTNGRVRCQITKMAWPLLRATTTRVRENLNTRHSINPIIVSIFFCFPDMAIFKINHHTSYSLKMIILWKQYQYFSSSDSKCIPKNIYIYIPFSLCLLN